MALIGCGLACCGFLSGTCPGEERPRETIEAPEDAATRVSDAEGIEFFERKIRPVLEKHCYRCHSDQAKRLKGGLRLDKRARIRAGGDTAPAVVPGDVDASLLIEALRYESLEMPPVGKLADAVIADFVTWVKIGAPDPREGEAIARKIDFDEARKFWAYRPARRRTPPAVEDQSWPRTPIDHFILAALEAKKLSPAPPASRRDLVRRVYFDLTGLPPSPEEVAAFLDDGSPGAYAKLVDRLLSSPHYGERWGQHWLDVVRYAETEGFEYDRAMPGSWRYRDYVIQAFNEDKPFDLFVREQLAGDEIAPERQEALIASGFHRFGAVRRNAGNQEVASSRNEILTERTDIVATAFLGLTLGCARCHDHMFDPIPQTDYYRMQAFLAATQENDVSLASAPETAAWKKKTEEVNAEIKRLKDAVKKLDGEAREALKKRLKETEGRLPPALPTLCSIRNDAAKRTPIHVLERGDWGKKGDPVGMRALSVLLPDAAPELPQETENPRTHLARWITDPEHPLTARVMVNRIWSYHFGLGIVKTPNDLGVNGDRPSHPELLEDLAREFVDNGWHMKPIHRMILLSSVYRQSSHSPDATKGMSLDPENRLRWRFDRRRLEAEEIRDAMLAASGMLERKAGGESVIVAVDEALVNLLYKPSQWAVTDNPSERYRRSIYLIAKRNLRLPFMEVFDQPTLQTSCARRESSNHAPQALEMLNGSTSNALAAAFAERLVREVGSDRSRQVERAFLLAIGRLPTDRERALALEFLKTEPLREFTLALFNLNAFLYVN